MNHWLNATFVAATIIRSNRTPQTARSRWSRSQLGLAGALALILAGLASNPALAQFGPSGRNIRIIVPFAPAGSSDVLARVLQAPLQEELKQTVIVENRAGAGTNIGTAEVARSEPDGYTLLLTSSAFIVNPALYKKIPYDPNKDFVPVAALPVAPNIFAIKPGNGIDSLGDVIARAKANPEALNYASPGNGTTPQLTMELFKLKAGVNITNIAYNGGGPATAALLGGTVDILSTALPGAQEQVRSGTMKGVALTTKQRWPTLPEVPTFIELGLPDITLTTEHFLLAPAGTPPDVVERLTKAVLTVLGNEDLKKRVLQVGYDPYVAGPDAVKDRINKGVPFFKDLISNAKIPQIE
jgi:tripartite-type tricarboxylate transporter receptor subunit TctC